MSDYVNNDMQDVPFDWENDTIDWAAMNEAVLQEPWLDDLDWSGYEQDTQTLPTSRRGVASLGRLACDMRLDVSQRVATATQEPGDTDPSTYVIDSASPTIRFLDEKEFKPDVGPDSTGSPSPEPTFKCEYDGCKSRPFKRQAELNRHQGKHQTTTPYPCPARGCNRVGSRSFYRKDKLKDHLLQGHDNDTLIECVCTKCSHTDPTKCKALTRDITAMSKCEHSTLSEILDSMNDYRECPIHKCPFRVRVGKSTRLDAGKMGPLTSHLIGHEPKRRANFASSIKERGYDPSTGEIVCPVCPDGPQFLKHCNFYDHFFEVHFQGPHKGIFMWAKLADCTHVPDEVRQHRRTLLSLWPEFEWYPVWEDIRCPGY